MGRDLIKIETLFEQKGMILGVDDGEELKISSNVDGFHLNDKM